MRLDAPFCWTDPSAGLREGYDRAMPYGDFDVTLDPNDAPVATEQLRHLEGFGLPAQQTVSTSATQYLHGDLIRSTMLTTGQGGTAVSAVSYTAFGEPIGTAPETRYQYAGGWGYESDLLVLEGAPGTAPIVLQHVGFRWYQPDIGRFIQRDPIGVLGGINVYAYVCNQPTVLVDPSGRCGWGSIVKWLRSLMVRVGLRGSPKGADAPHPGPRVGWTDNPYQCGPRRARVHWNDYNWYDSIYEFFNCIMPTVIPHLIPGFNDPPPSPGWGWPPVGPFGPEGGESA